jgi:hypothetical protein
MYDSCAPVVLVRANTRLNHCSMMTNTCSMCGETLLRVDGISGSPTRTTMLSNGPRAPWCIWPCGHGVHKNCGTKSIAHLETLDGPCHVCGTPQDPSANNFLNRTLSTSFNKASTKATSLGANVPHTPQGRPLVVAVCCWKRERNADGTFVTLDDGNFNIIADKRMSYMGLDDEEWMFWRCSVCESQIHLREMPTKMQHCPEHGPMCIMITPNRDSTCNAKLSMTFSGATNSHLWQCCDMSKGYEPVLLYHLRKQTDDAGNVVKTV